MSEASKTKLNKELLNATAAGDLDKVTKLLNKGADVNAQDSMGNTPLHLASKIGITYLVTKLISSYANINAKNKNNHTPLDEACFNGCEGVKDQLLMWKADFGCNYSLMPHSYINVANTLNFGNNPVEDKTIKEKLHEELLLLKDKYGFELGVLWTRQDIVKCGDKVAMLANSINVTIYLFSEIILEGGFIGIDELPGLMNTISQDVKERVEYLKKQKEK